MNSSCKSTAFPARRTKPSPGISNCANRDLTGSNEGFGSPVSVGGRGKPVCAIISLSIFRNCWRPAFGGRAKGFTGGPWWDNRFGGRPEEVPGREEMALPGGGCEFRARLRLAGLAALSAAICFAAVSDSTVACSGRNWASCWVGSCTEGLEGTVN
jgi:hypothetical protein